MCLKGNRTGCCAVLLRTQFIPSTTDVQGYVGDFVMNAAANNAASSVRRVEQEDSCCRLVLIVVAVVTILTCFATRDPAAVPKSNTVMSATSPSQAETHISPDEPGHVMKHKSLRRSSTARGVGRKGSSGPASFSLPETLERSDDETRLRLWQAERLCVFVPTEAIDENSIRETTSAMRSWGDHRTFLVEFKGFFLAEAERTHAALLAAWQRSHKLASDPEAWVAAAVAMARTVGNATLMVDVSTSVIPPSLLLVPPERPVPIPADSSVPRGAFSPDELHWMRVRRLLGEREGEGRTAAVGGDSWRLRDPRDVVLVFREDSPELLAMRRVFVSAHGDQQASAWLSKEAKSVLMWDYVTRMLHWPGRADGQPASADREALWAAGFSQCEWVMKADTDTYVNRPALRENELLGLHNINGDTRLRVLSPRRDAVYVGFPMSFGPEMEFAFGGLGYYFSRATLNLVHHEPLITFRECAHITRFTGKDVMLPHEDAIIGRCVRSWNDRAHLGISVQFVFPHRITIGNATNMMTAYLSRRHKCVCCMRTLHTVDAAAHAFLEPIMKRHCHSPATTGRPRLATMSDDAAAFCNSFNTSQVCPFRSIDDRPVTYNDTGVAGGDNLLPDS
jgi:hypothetical protein